MAIGPRLAKRAPWAAALTLVAAALGGVAILASRPRPTIVRAVAPKNLEQTALEEIVRSYWGPALFESSEPCAPSGFDPDVPLMVFRDRPGYWATMLDFAPLA